MAIFQSETAKRRKPSVTPGRAGEVVCDISEFTFSAAFAFATDKVELGVLPAGMRLVDAIAVGENLNGNITIGLMSGNFGEADNARTVGAEILSAVALASTLQRLTLPAALAIAPTQADRGIGLTGSADIAAAANKKVRLYLFYVPAE